MHLKNWGWTQVKKANLTAAVEATKTETQAALQLVVDELNHGQQKKIVKNEAVKALLDRYGVTYSE